MCGIFGVIRDGGEGVDSALTRLLADRMIHRGPDDEGVVARGSWAIGMRRLSIIDLAGGHQPIANEDGTIHVVLNGEIYNFQELRQGLTARGHRFATHSDVEVLVHLYEEYGREAIHHLNGMFAFALFDERKGELWVARDRLGIKPLYYGRAGDAFAFSSELSGLAAVLDAPLSPSALVNYLGYSYIPAPDTAYQGIAKLMPGEEMVLSGGRLELNRYWNPFAERQWSGGVDEAVARFDELLRDAVDMQLVSDVPLGVFLSGGVDSSAIASYAADRSGDHPLETFTIDFEGKGGSDSLFAADVSRRLATRHHVITVSADDQFAALGELIALMDEPMSDSAIVPTYMLSKAARDHGMKVLLSGAGGDEIFGGYPRHFPGRRFTAAWFATLPRPLRELAAFGFGVHNPALRTRLRHPARNFAVNISGVNFQFMSEALRPAGELGRLLGGMERDFADAGSKNAYPLMKLDLNHYLPDNVLSLTDKATMAASVEGRVPLLDHRIVEFAFSLPEDVNLLRGEQKGLFKEVLAGRLPNELLFREKEGFNAPIHSWVERWPDRLKDELLGATSPTIAEMVDVGVVESWLADPKRRRCGGASLYALFVLNRWLNSRS